jgi:threonylcarbamoyladenosine tRNA methylthiotransferase CDKAL1
MIQTCLDVRFLKFALVRFRVHVKLARVTNVYVPVCALNVYILLMGAIMRIYVRAFGCSSSLADGEVLSGCLAAHGHTIVTSLPEADLVVYNTCAVKGPTENRMISLLKRVPPDTKLVVAGCLPLINEARLRREVRFDGLVGPACGDEIVEVVGQVANGVPVEQLMTAAQAMPPLDLPRVRVNPLVGVIPISYGCTGACAYCCVRFARGTLRSFAIPAIVDKVKQDLTKNVREFWLTAQDTAAYGLDRGSHLATLLQQLCAVKGDFLVRVGMMTPSSVLGTLDDLIAAFAHEKVFKFLHLPLQSGDDNVLHQMTRYYSVDDFIMIVKRFRRTFPHLTLATDTIVGFPGETEAAFRHTLELVKVVQPDVVNISKFFPRPGTVAVDLTPRVPRSVVNQRSARLAHSARQIALTRNREWQGWQGETLIDELGTPGSVVGRNFAYKPIVVKGRDVADLLGRSVIVKVVDAFQSHLLGTIL